MKTTRWFLAGVGVLAVGGLGLTSAQTAPPAPTYTKDVAPILFRNCTSCHRPGEIAPMSLLTYDDVRPHAKDIRDEVGEGHMPPWHAAAPKGTFLNERGLTDEEKRILVAVGEHRRKEGRPQGPAAGSGLYRRLGHRQAGRGVRNGGGIQGPGRRGDRGPVLLHPDQLHRGEVDSGDRVETRATGRSCTTRWRSIEPSPTCSVRPCCVPTGSRW